MKEAYQIVREKAGDRKKKDNDRGKRDGKKMLGDVAVGERVLVKNSKI